MGGTDGATSVLPAPPRLPSSRRGQVPRRPADTTGCVYAIQAPADAGPVWCNWPRPRLGFSHQYTDDNLNASEPMWSPKCFRFIIGIMPVLADSAPRLLSFGYYVSDAGFPVQLPSPGLPGVVRVYITRYRHSTILNIMDTGIFQ